MERLSRRELFKGLLGFASISITTRSALSALIKDTSVNMAPFTYGEVSTINLSEVFQRLSNMKGYYSLTKIGTIFGEEQAVQIFEKYNPSADNFIVNKNSSNPTIKANKIGDVTFPLVYDYLDTFFNPLLENFLLQNPKFHGKLQGNETVLIATKDHTGRYCIGYYENGILKTGTYASLGKEGKSTSKGVFKIGNKIERKWSSLYSVNGTKIPESQRGKIEGAAMPYALNIQDNNGNPLDIFIHTGFSDGKGLSHGCIRVPLLWAVWFYENVPQETKVLIV